VFETRVNIDAVDVIVSGRWTFKVLASFPMTVRGAHSLNGCWVT